MGAAGNVGFVASSVHVVFYYGSFNSQFPVGCDEIHNNNLLKNNLNIH